MSQSQPMQIGLLGATLRVAQRGSSTEPSPVSPRIRIDFEISNNFPAGQGGNNLRVSISSVEFSIRTREGQVHYLCRGYIQQPTIVLSPNSPVVIPVFLDVGPLELRGIEKVRGDSELNLLTYFRGFAEQHGQPQSGLPFEGQLNMQIAKSDWVEKILLQCGYKDVSLIEMPRLPDLDFVDAVRHVDEAWRRYAMGENGNVLLECRKSLEALSEKLREKGYETTEEDSGHQEEEC